tara:strand:- start:56 stop:358 length:303 start_codon:yes stop_codon:yes gene_type:complete
MNNKQKEIEADIKRQMIALSAQMDALNEWKATGYNNEICTPALHDWATHKHNIDTRSDAEPFILHRICVVCGIEQTQTFRNKETDSYDNWRMFREGGEEE